MPGCGARMTAFPTCSRAFASSRSSCSNASFFASRFDSALSSSLAARACTRSYSRFASSQSVYACSAIFGNSYATNSSSAVRACSSATCVRWCASSSASSSLPVTYPLSFSFRVHSTLLAARDSSSFARSISLARPRFFWSASPPRSASSAIAPKSAASPSDTSRSATAAPRYFFRSRAANLTFNAACDSRLSFVLCWISYCFWACS